MIRIQNLKKIYTSNKSDPVTALKDINLHIKENEIFGIVGLSGAGKSTLIRTLNRLEEPSDGQIYLDGKDITQFNKKELREARQHIGMIFQHFDLLKSKTVFDNIAFPLKLVKHNKEAIEERVTHLLELVELSDKRNAYPAQLSGGQKQRVAIARALANNPKLLLSDEATSALDPKTTKSILRLLKNLQKELGLTIVLITHQMEVVREICDRVAIMEGGEVIELGPVTDVFAHPKTETAKSFISNMHHSDQEEILFPKSPQSKVLKLSFVGDLARQPIISQMIRTFDIDVNILSGNIDELMSTSIGTLYIQLLGDQKLLGQATNWLREQDLSMEVIWNG